jgi:hypothetical protein
MGRGLIGVLDSPGDPTDPAAALRTAFLGILALLILVGLLDLADDSFLLRLADPLSILFSIDVVIIVGHVFLLVTWVIAGKSLSGRCKVSI